MPHIPGLHVTHAPNLASDPYELNTGTERSMGELEVPKSQSFIGPWLASSSQDQSATKSTPQVQGRLKSSS
ncbi:hypothetical protein TWF679_009686 [Orbilia oligospora]|uniref:Uncharacterized protein n=1 Tax=Orbilia oligospora TaxID=2813651 RepID=A0A8H8VJF2_ORBOL|nr:hypothetical protein TWF679_009686 [Orbilia oligospora]